MLEFLKHLCKSNSLTVHKFETNLKGVTAQLAVPSDGNSNQEYYFIIENECISDAFLDEVLEKHAEELMDRLEVLDCVNESFRKNSTLILCCKSGRLSDQYLLKFEEDPYYFKKNIITYSIDELTSLKEELNAEYTNEHLNKLLMKSGGDLFESFKTTSLEEGHYYPLLIKIITKLPFVHYLPQPNQLNDLEGFIRNALDESDINLLDFICEGEFSSDVMDEKIAIEWVSNE